MATRANGQQLNFNKQMAEDEIQFNYNWLDQAQHEQQLHFALPKDLILQQSNKHTRYQPEQAKRYIYIELMKAIRAVDPKEANIHLQKLGQELQIRVRSRQPQNIEKWRHYMLDAKEKALQDYLQENHYTQFRSFQGQDAVKPDHMRYIKETLPMLVPVANAIYQQIPENSDARIYINFILGWLQAVPYDVLEDRVTSNGAGYLPPLDVIMSNRGDCDSKSTLAAALIRLLLPNVPMVMLYLPDHALLGIQLPYRDTDPIIEIDGLPYLLLEPTGPASMNVAEAASTSLQAINAGMFMAEKVP